jgi:hypothetical protein
MPTLEEKLVALTNQAPVMVFMKGERYRTSLRTFLCIFLYQLFIVIFPKR